MIRLPPLGTIQAFVQVARLGSFKAAADSLALSSPALTRRIQSLEQFVGAPLLERQHNAVVVNERGEALLGEIGPHLDALALAVDRATDDHRNMRLRIAVPSLFAAQRLVPALPSLQRKHPNLLIDVDTAANRISRLGDDADVAIVIGTSVEERHYARLIENGRVVAIGARHYAEGNTALVSPTELRAMTILLHRQMPAAFQQWRAAAGHTALEPNRISYFDAGQLMLDAAAEGLGIAFMLETHLACSQDRRIARVFNTSAESPYAYWFVCPPTALKRRAVRIFHDWLFEQFGGTSSASPIGKTLLS